MGQSLVGDIAGKHNFSDGSAVKTGLHSLAAELDILQKLQKGKSPEEQQRLRDAAMHMIKGEAGVNKYDPRYQEIKASSDRGAGYTAEQQMLRTASESKKGERQDKCVSSDYILHLLGKKIQNWFRAIAHP